MFDKVMKGFEEVFGKPMSYADAVDEIGKLNRAAFHMGFTGDKQACREQMLKIATVAVKAAESC